MPDSPLTHSLQSAVVVLEDDDWFVRVNLGDFGGNTCGNRWRDEV
jgi:hypothetical protein